MYCKNCGKIVDDDSKFCRYCGTNQSNIITEKTLHKFKNNIKKQNNPSENVEDIKKITSFYDNSYSKEYNAALVGGILILGNLAYIIFGPSIDFSDSETYEGIAFINFIWRVIAANWCVNIATRQNRFKNAWGIFALLVPNLALVILGFSKKIKPK